MRDVKMKKIIIADSLKNFIEQDVSLIAGYDNKVFYIKSAQEALDIHRKERANLIIITLDYSDLSCERIMFGYTRGRSSQGSLNTHCLFGKTLGH